MSGTEYDWLVREPGELLTEDQQRMLNKWSEQFDDVQVSPNLAPILFEQLDWTSWDDDRIRSFFETFGGMDKDIVREQLGLEDPRRDSDGGE